LEAGDVRAGDAGAGDCLDTAHAETASISMPAASAQHTDRAVTTTHGRVHQIAAARRDCCPAAGAIAGYPALGDAVCEAETFPPDPCQDTPMIISPVLASRKIHLVHWMAGKLEPEGQVDQLYP